MELIDLVRKEMDIEGWKDKPKLVKRILKQLNHLHRDAVQKVLVLEGYIEEAGGVPLIEVTVVFPKPVSEPEPDPPEETP